jgi:hypothetical protein
VPEDLKPIIEEVGRDAYKVAGIFDETWYEETMNGFGEKVEILPLSDMEQKIWDKKFGEVLVTWAEDLEAKGLPAKKALVMFKEELGKVDVPFDACPY